MSLKRCCDWCLKEIHDDLGNKIQRTFLRISKITGNENPKIAYKYDFCSQLCLKEYLKGVNLL